MKKRIVCLILALVMLVCDVPLTLFAQEAEPTSTQTDLNVTREDSSAGSLYYVMNGGSFVSGFTPVTEGEPGTVITLPESEKISRPGYIFLGWFTTKKLDEGPVTTLELGDVEKYVYAGWKERYFNVTIPDITSPLGIGELEVAAEMAGSFEGDKIDISLTSEEN